MREQVPSFYLGCHSRTSSHCPVRWPSRLLSQGSFLPGSDEEDGWRGRPKYSISRGAVWSQSILSAGKLCAWFFSGSQHHSPPQATKQSVKWELPFPCCQNLGEVALHGTGRATTIFSKFTSNILLMRFTILWIVAIILWQKQCFGGSWSRAECQEGVVLGQILLCHL